MAKVGIYGIGRMGGSLARGLLKSGQIQPSDLSFSDRGSKNVNEIKKSHKEITIVSKLSEMVEVAEIIILATPSHTTLQLLNDFNVTDKAPMFASLSAGLSLAQLRTGNQLDIIRVLPNILVERCSGTTLIVNEGSELKGRSKIVSDLFSSIGQVVSVPEESLPAWAYFTSSGPALIASILKSFMKQANLETSTTNTDASTVIGNALAPLFDILSDGLPAIEEFIESLVAPGGITAEALSVLEPKISTAFKQAFADAQLLEKQIESS